MRFGMLVVSTNTKSRPCIHCKEEIATAIQYPSVTYFRVGATRNKSFAVKLHWDCLRPWCEENTDKRVKAHKRPGRKPLDATEEVVRTRKKVQFYLYDCRKALIKAYTNSDPVRIREVWARYAKWLTEYGTEEVVGRLPKYTFGDEVKSCMVEYGHTELLEKLSTAAGNPQILAALIIGYLEAPDDTVSV